MFEELQYWALLIGLTLILLSPLQILFTGAALQALLRRIFYRHTSLGFHGIFFVPLLYFRSGRFRLMFHGESTHDRVYFEAKQVSFRIDPFFLLLGRLRLVNLKLKDPYLEYINRMESHKKNRFLPARHRIELKRAHITGGRLFVRDETMTPVYRLEMTGIELDNMDLDIGTPIDFLFRTERGEAEFASGRIEIGQTRGVGFIRLRDVAWTEIASLEKLPFTGRLALSVSHTGGSRSRSVQGQISATAAPGAAGVPGESTASIASIKDPHKSLNNVNFQFDIDWNDYGVTLDLGLQRLIGKILDNADAGWLGQGIVIGGRGVFEILKKPEA
ncbi:MAG: hypothetical protein NXI24_13650 [bacterium]|nr:hypothetical protein [bacterium]